MLTDRDKDRLIMVDSRLTKVVVRAALDNPGLFFVDKDAARGVNLEMQLIAAGKAHLKDPYNSKHVIGPKRPLSHAVDLYPCGYPNLAKIPHEAYAKVAYAMKTAAAEEGVKIGWGFELWSGFDSPHYQLMEP